MGGILMKIHRLEYSYDKNDRISISKDIKSAQGVYALLDKNLEVLYIGETINFRQRLNCHISKNNTSRKLDPSPGQFGFNTYLPLNIVDYYIFIPSGDKLERLMIESFIIKYFSPKFNRICLNCESDTTEATLD
jgi:excinuclease UvrABC nuclease subunit